MLSTSKSLQCTAVASVNACPVPPASATTLYMQRKLIGNGLYEDSAFNGIGRPIENAVDRQR